MPALIQASDSLSDVLRSAKQAAIDGAGASIELVAAKPGKRAVAIHVYIESEGTTSVTFKSDTTALSGPINLAADDILELRNDGFPVLIGHDFNKALTVANSGSVQLNGFVVYAVVDTK